MRPNLPIQIPPGRKLRVLLYGRFSTDEQNPLSIADQFAACLRLLAACGIVDFEIERISDEGISGELESRPGIDSVRMGISQGRWDLIIVEESSRLFRNAAFSLILVLAAVRAGIRTICINDYIDTADVDWQDDLLAAQQHHQKSNKFTRQRIERAYLARWESGAAVTWLRPGYARRASRPATSSEPARGPFFDELAPQWASVVEAAFGRMADKEEPWIVVKFLNDSNLPRCRGSHSDEWDEDGLLAMVRNPLYRGTEVNGNTVTERLYPGAKPVQSRNKPEKVRSRAMPHLRIVSDAVWYRANAYIDARMRKPRTAYDAVSPLKGIPRDSRQPLSQLFVCGICKQKMWGDGRNEGGYRCSGAKEKLCWNRATSLRAIAHEQLGRAIVKQLTEDREVLLAEIDAITALAGSDESVVARIQEVESNLASLNRRKFRLDEAIENSSESVTSLLARRDDLAAQQRVAGAELEELRNTHQRHRELPTAAEVLQAIEATAARLLTLDPEVTATLKRLLVGPIEAVPFRQFGLNKIVLRARLTIRYFDLIQFDLRRLIAANGCSAGFPTAIERTLLVDLFDPPDPIKYLKQSWDHSQANPKATLDEMAAALSMPKHRIHNSILLGRALAAANQPEPYSEVIQPPAAASRWKSGLLSDNPSGTIS